MFIQICVSTIGVKGFIGLSLRQSINRNLAHDSELLIIIQKNTNEDKNGMRGREGEKRTECVSDSNLLIVR